MGKVMRVIIYDKNFDIFDVLQQELCLEQKVEILKLVVFGYKRVFWLLCDFR